MYILCKDFQCLFLAPLSPRWCQSFDSANIFRTTVYSGKVKESQESHLEVQLSLLNSQAESPLTFLCITPSIITNASTSFADTCTETGRGEGYEGSELRDSMESIGC